MSNKENSYKIPSISSLQQEKSIKEKGKNDIFNIVLTKIIQKITYTNRHTEQTYIIFEIPKMLIGYPQYDMKSCILFVMNQLSNNGYIVEFVQPFYLYIDWGCTKQNPGTNDTYNDIKGSLTTKHKDKLQTQTKALLSQFPNTSHIEFVYEDKLKDKLKNTKRKKGKK
jgi:hypothetical protein